jgi:hypothetical protein
VQTETLNRVFIDDTGEAGIGLGVGQSVNAHVGALFLQTFRCMHACCWKGRGPLPKPQVMIQVRRIQVADAPQRFDGCTPLGYQAHGRIHEEAPIPEAQHGHSGSQRHAKDACWHRANPHAVSEGNK